MGEMSRWILISRKSGLHDHYWKLSAYLVKRKSTLYLVSQLTPPFRVVFRLSDPKNLFLPNHRRNCFPNPLPCSTKFFSSAEVEELKLHLASTPCSLFYLPGRCDLRYLRAEHWVRVSTAGGEWIHCRPGKSCNPNFLLAKLIKN